MKFCPNCGVRLKLSAIRKMRGQPAVCQKCGTPIVATEKEAPPVKTALTQSFPYGQMRPFQKDVMEKIESALVSGRSSSSSRRRSGSASRRSLPRSAATSARPTSSPRPSSSRSKYSADFGFTTVMGKSNFTCHVPTSSGRLVACSKGRCEADWRLSDCPHYLTFEQYEDHLKGLCDKNSKCEKLRGHGNGKVCSYYQQKWDSFRQDVTVGNYPFFFSELRSPRTSGGGGSWSATRPTTWRGSSSALRRSR